MPESPTHSTLLRNQPPHTLGVRLEDSDLALRASRVNPKQRQALALVLVLGGVGTYAAAQMGSTVDAPERPGYLADPEDKLNISLNFREEIGRVVLQELDQMDLGLNEVDLREATANLNFDDRAWDVPVAQINSDANQWPEFWDRWRGKDEKEESWWERAPLAKGLKKIWVGVLIIVTAISGTGVFLFARGAKERGWKQTFNSLAESRVKEGKVVRGTLWFGLANLLPEKKPKKPEADERSSDPTAATSVSTSPLSHSNTSTGAKYDESSEPLN